MKYYSRHKYLLFCFIIICFIGGLWPESLAARSEAVRFQEAYDAIDRYARQFMKRLNIPGLSMALTSREGLLRVSAYGFADIKSRIPLTPDMLFQIGSVTKSFTAVALMQLNDEGKFDPHEPVTRYLPWFSVKSKYKGITVHHLLNHTSGIPANRDDIPGGMYMPYGLRYRSTGYAPGKTFHYSNVGYQTLHFVLEKLRGEEYEKIIRKRIFEPLGMVSSLAKIDHHSRKRQAAGYVPYYDDRPSHRSHGWVEGTWLTYNIGDGAIVSNPRDMAAYMRMILNQGKGPKGRVISEKAFKAFSTPDTRLNKELTYAYGIGAGKMNGFNCLMHGGGMVGHTCFMVCDMDNGLGVMVFDNGQTGGYRLAKFALEALQAVILKKKLPEVPALKQPAVIENAADYAGTFTAPGGKTLTFRAEGKSLLLMHKDTPIGLERRGKDAFYALHPDFDLYLLQFRREPGKKEKEKKEKQKVTEVLYGADWYAGKDYKGPRVFKYPKQWQAYTGHYRTQNPWFSNFRVLLRKGKLFLATSAGTESSEGQEGLIEIEPGMFKTGKGNLPEILRFDSIAEGKALRAEFSGCYFYRVSD
jgi:CubicO group peptidase (beta-lactamase class C family)